MRSQFTIVRTPVPVYVSTVEDAVRWLDYFKKRAEREGLGVDTETTGLDIIRDRMRFFSLATSEARIAVPVRLLSVFEELLEDEDIEKHLTNTKFDQHMLANAGVRLRGHILDTADMDFLIDENREGDHGLKECALEYLGLRMTPFKEVFGNAGSTNDEVAMMCEIHDILELHDHEGEVEKANALARDILLQLERVEGEPAVLKNVNRLLLSLKADRCTLTARQVITVAEEHGVVEQHSGTHRVVSEFFALLGNVGEVDVKQRKLLLPDTEDDDLLREVTQTVFDALLAMTGIPENPIEFLRTSVADYASLDAWASHALVPAMRKMLARPEMAMITEDVRAGRAMPRFLLQHSEEKRVPFIQTLWNMERRGFKIDVEGCKPYSIEMLAVVEQAERDIVRETGDLQFNPGSPQQLLEKFFTFDKSEGWRDPFGDSPKKWTDGGASGVKAPSTKKEVLEEFAGKGNVLAEIILRHRQFSKLRNDYMEGLPRWVDRNLRIHTGLKSTGAVTWRISSSAPNLQNIPAKDPYWGPRIRSQFVAGLWGECSPELCLEHLRDVPVPRLSADQPMRLLIADYKQLEVCIVCHWCEDEAMTDAILSGQDLHCKTVVAASALGAAGLPKGITYEEAVSAKKASGKAGYTMTKNEEFLVNKRSQLKSTLFGIVYGIGGTKLGMQLKLPIVKKTTKYKSGVTRTRDVSPEAEELIDTILHKVYPRMGEWIEDTHAQCADDLGVFTVAGHPRRLPDILSNDGGKRSGAERQSVNTLAQGSGADIVNEAMIRCESDAQLRRLGVRLLLQIHDELIFEVPDLPEFVEPAKKRIKELMENPFPMRVPILIDISDGLNWGAKH